VADNVIRRGKAFSQSRIRELRELVMDGFSNNEIMRAMGMTATATAKAIHNHARDIRRARRENGCTLSCRGCTLPCELTKFTNRSLGKCLGYTGKPCPNCGRFRVERYENGKEICEKCEWCLQEGGYVDRERMYTEDTDNESDI